MIHVHGKSLVEFVKDVFICELLNLCSSKTTLSPRRVDVSPRGRGGCPAGETECFRKGEVKDHLSLIPRRLHQRGFDDDEALAKKNIQGFQLHQEAPANPYEFPSVHSLDLPDSVLSCSCSIFFYHEELKGYVTWIKWFYMMITPVDTDEYG
ncbi:hypothetical protein IRJ41_022461 [Triplophysa rosa]|uniref:Uncharacterized protein n=1 Tax=Triplophysa rosa TaxID=992332 RepID=A0A9W7X1B4_TRIRA|nr:hypothetical protein IRJ41_022461 [Triplophysa rosa]